jgi:hypothetical protein
MAKSTVPPQMDSPAKLPDGDFWAWVCPVCHLCMQGGRAGLNAHMAVVHLGAEGSGR